MSSSEDAANDAEEGQSTSIENKSPSQITYYYNALSQQRFHTFDLNTSNQDFLVDLLHTKAKIKYDAHVTLAKRLEDVKTVAKELSGRAIFRYYMHQHLKKSLGVVVHLVAACQALDGPFEEFLGQATREPVKAAIAEGTISRDEDDDETPITVPHKQYGNFQHLVKQTMKEFRDRLTVMGFDEYTFDNHFSLAYSEAAAIIMLTTSVALAGASFYIQEATTMARITAAVLAALSAMSGYVATFVPVLRRQNSQKNIYTKMSLYSFGHGRRCKVSQVEQKLDAKALDFLSNFKESYFIDVDGDEGPLFLKKKELSPDMCSQNRRLDASILNPVAEKPKKKKKKKKKKEEEAGRCITQ